MNGRLQKPFAKQAFIKERPGVVELYRICQENVNAEMAGDPSSAERQQGLIPASQNFVDSWNVQSQIEEGRKVSMSGFINENEEISITDADGNKKWIQVQEPLLSGYNIPYIQNPEEGSLGESVTDPSTLVSSERSPEITEPTKIYDTELQASVQQPLPNTECSQSYEAEPQAPVWQTSPNTERSWSYEAEPQISVRQPLPNTERSQRYKVEPQAPVQQTVANTERPQIYKPGSQGTDKQKYTSPKQVSAREIVKEAVEKIIRENIIRTVGEEIYILRSYPARFKKLAGNEAQQFINKFVREKMNCECTVSDIDKIKKSLLYDDRIICKEVDSLPPYYWPFVDGLVDIRTGIKIPNEGQFFYTNCFSCSYDGSKQCPCFDDLIDTMTGSDPLLQERIWEIIGYILSNDNNAKSFFSFIGPKDTGKSLLANIISGIFLEGAVASCGIGEFGRKFANADFIDKRLVISTDLTDAVVGAAAVGTVKSITGGDLMRLEEKHKKARSGKLTCKLLFGSNFPIRTEKPDPAFNERQVVVPFNYPIPKDRQNKQLVEELKEETGGIVNKAIKAYLRLVANNYIFQEIGNQIPEGLCIDQEKVIKDFSLEICDFTDVNAKIFTEDLHNKYQEFCLLKGIQPLEKDEFSKVFNNINKGDTVEKRKINIKGDTRMGYRGVKIREN